LASIVETEMFVEPREIATYLYELLKEAAGELGIAFVGYGEKLRPQYPAAIVMPGSKIKALHATHTFNVNIETTVLVYHAALNNSTVTRTEDDLELVEGIEHLIEQGEMNLNGHVIFVYVRDVLPGTVLRPTGEQVVGSRMIIESLSQKRF
jgi:hypothetical protein